MRLFLVSIFCLSLVSIVNAQDKPQKTCLHAAQKLNDVPEKICIDSAKIIDSKFKGAVLLLPNALNIPGDIKIVWMDSTHFVASQMITSTYSGACGAEASMTVKIYGSHRGAIAGTLVDAQDLHISILHSSTTDNCHVTAQETLIRYL